MFTVSDWLSMPCVENSIVLSAQKLLAEAPIEHVAVIEIPVEDFIRENELVISTAIGCLNDEDLLLKFIQNIYLSNAACLGLSIKKENYEIPVAVLDYIRSVNFPVILIPWECRFSEIIETVIHEIKTKNEKKIHFFESIQRKLLAEYLNSNSMNDAANTISKSLKIPIIITDYEYNIKGICKNINSDSLDKHTLVNNFNIVANISVKDILYGYILTNNNNMDYSDNSQNFENYISVPLSLWFNKEDIIDTTRLNMIVDFIWTMALNESESQQNFHSKAKLLGYDLNRSYTCMVGQVKNLNSIKFLKQSSSFLKDSDMVNLVNHVNLQSITSSREIISTYKDDMVLIYLETHPGDNTANINDFLDRIDSKAKSIDSSFHISWGISEIKNKEADFHKLYLNAKLALDLSTIYGHEKSRYTYEDSNIFMVLTTLKRNSEVENIVKSTLENIIENDKKKNGNIMHTLTAYIRNNYNISKTARELHLHRQSLLYRLDKIQTLTNLSFDNHDNLFLLEICARLHSN